jgi:urea transport system ATP-binding protein
LSALLDIEDVKAGYKSDMIPVIDKVSFRAERGTALILIGKNGSGKSTLLRALAGDPQVYFRGRVRFQGQTAVCKPHWWQKRSVLWIPQQGGSFEDLSVRENLVLAANWAGAPRIDAALQLFPDLSNLLMRKAAHLSGGERRMLELAVVTFLTSPAAIFIDEPTAPLSSQNSARFLKHVETLLDNGTAIILATHKDELGSRAHEVVYIGGEV